LVDCLNDNEIAFGSTEFIVMRARKNISPYWVYCLARNENFRAYAISSMVGSSGRQRVHSDYLKLFQIPRANTQQMTEFHEIVEKLFGLVKVVFQENTLLKSLLDNLLSKLAKAK